MRSSRKTRVFISICRTIYRREGEGSNFINSFSCQMREWKDYAWETLIIFPSFLFELNGVRPARISWHEAGNLMPRFLASHRISRRRRSHATESSNQTIANDRRTTIGNDNSWPTYRNCEFALQPRTIYDRIGVHAWLIRAEAGMHVYHVMNSSLLHHDKLMIVIPHGDLLNNFIKFNVDGFCRET